MHVLKETSRSKGMGDGFFWKVHRDESKPLTWISTLREGSREGDRPRIEREPTKGRRRWTRFAKLPLTAKSRVQEGIPCVRRSRSVPPKRRIEWIETERIGLCLRSWASTVAWALSQHRNHNASKSAQMRPLPDPDYSTADRRLGRGNPSRERTLLCRAYENDWQVKSSISKARCRKFTIHSERVRLFNLRKMPCCPSSVAGTIAAQENVF